MILYTTLIELRKHEPCTHGYKKLLKYLGKDYPYEEPIDLLTILESNGLNDTLWAFRCALPETGRDRIARLFACDCAEAVLHLYEKKYPNDSRPRAAIETARRYAEGKATKDELKEAWSASRSASRSATWSASRSAAWSVAWSAAWSAAESVAEERAKQTIILGAYLRGIK